jgi:hypothetical protein
MHPDFGNGELKGYHWLIRGVNCIFGVFLAQSNSYTTKYWSVYFLLKNVSIIAEFAELSRDAENLQGCFGSTSGSRKQQAVRR